MEIASSIYDGKFLCRASCFMQNKYFKNNSLLGHQGSETLKFTKNIGTSIMHSIHNTVVRLTVELFMQYLEVRSIFGLFIEELR